MDVIRTTRIVDGYVVMREVYPKLAGVIIETWRNANGQLHCSGNLPAVTYSYEDKHELVEQWFNENQLHRQGDLPAEIRYENGLKIIERWYKGGLLSRDGDLPAEIWYKNDQKIYEAWFKHGRRHRSGDLPAVVGYRGGIRTNSLWYSDGRWRPDPVAGRSVSSDR